MKRIFTYLPLEMLLAVLLCLLPTLYFMPNIGQMERALPFNSMAILSAAILICIAVFKVGNAKEIKFSKLFLCLFASVVILISPILYMHSELYAFMPRLGMISFSVIFLLGLYQVKPNRLHLLWAIFICGIVQTAWGYHQFYNEGYAPHGIFQQTNVYGSFLATCIAVSGYLVLNTKNGLAKFFSSLLTLFSTFILYQSGSRTAILSLLLIFICFLFPVLKKRTSGSAMLWLGCYIFGLVGAYYLSILPKVATDTGVSIVSSAVTMESSGREYIYPQVLRMIQENFFSGVGFGNFQREYLVSTAKWFDSGEFYTYGLHNMDHPHSELLYWTVEGGIVSLGAFLLIVGFILHRLFKLPLNNGVQLLAMIMPISLHILLEYPIYHSFVHLFLFLILIYMLDSYAGLDEISVSVSGFRRRVIYVTQAAILIPALCLLLSVTYANYQMNYYSKTKGAELGVLSFNHNNVILGYRYNSFYMQKMIQHAINSRDEKSVRDFVVWAEKENAIRPIVSNYRYLIFAYKSLDELTNAKRVQDEADLLYPKYQFAKRNFEVPKVVN